MSVETEQGQRPEKVEDEEGTVARKLKDGIIEVRERVDEREDQLFVGPMVDEQLNRQISYGQALNAWGNTVRQYIRKIRPLLINDEVEDAKKYRENVELGTYVMPPPDHGGYRFSLFANPNVDATQLKQKMGLPRQTEPPEPREFTFNGLLSLLEQQRIEAQWAVKVSADGPEPEHETVYPSKTEPIPKFILESAVMHADEFLQSAGIGLNLDRGKPHGET